MNFKKMNIKKLILCILMIVFALLVVHYTTLLFQTKEGHVSRYWRNQRNHYMHLSRRQGRQIRKQGGQIRNERRAKNWHNRHRINERNAKNMYRNQSKKLQNQIDGLKKQIKQNQAKNIISLRYQE